MSEETEQRISLEELPDYITTLERKLEEARKACRNAAKIFREYQQLHLKKGTPEGRCKADANGAHAEALENISPPDDAFLSTLEGEKGGKE